MSSANRKKPQFIVYILRCADGTFYTGHTKDLEVRLKLHNAGRGAKYVRGRGPVEVIYSRIYRDHALAAGEEYRIKTLTRLQKEALVKSVWSKRVSVK